MAAPNQKVNNGKAVPQPAATDTPQGGITTADRKLLGYVRGNAQQIVASITLAAAQARTERDWPQMNEYLGIANEISHLCGLNQGAIASGGAGVQTMAARAGAQ